jgi:transposase
LTAVWVPDEAHEAMRDLVRLRAQALRDLRKARQQLLSFLLRHGLVSPYGQWTKMHRRWLGELVFAHPAQHLAHEEILQRIERAEALCDRLKAAILELVPQWSLAPVVEAIQALRGVSLIVASVIVAEVGNFGRLDSPRRLMAYLGAEPVGAFERLRSGAVPSPRPATHWYAPSWSRRPGPIGFRPASPRSYATGCVSRSVTWPGRRKCGCRRGIASSSPPVKPAPKVVVAIARELVGFIWAIARMVEPKFA